MKKLNFFLCVGLTAGASAFALQQSPLPDPGSAPQEATPVQKTPMKAPTSDYSEYVLPINDTDYLGLNLLSDGTFAVYEIFTDNESLEIPDSLQGYQITQISDSYGILLMNARSLKSLTVPRGTTGIYLWPDYSYSFSLEELHITGEYLPNYFDSNIAESLSCFFSTPTAYEQALLKWGDVKKLAREGWDYDWITINVSKVGEFAQEYLSACESSWYIGRYIKVKGELNSDDLVSMRNLDIPIKLDLSEAQFEALPDAFMKDKKSLLEVTLPTCASIVEHDSFNGCRNLEKINLGNVTEIRSQAFKNCISLQNVDFSNLSTVGYNAFIDVNLENADLSNIITFEGGAFYKAKLGVVSLDKAQTIGNDAFAYSTIKSVKLPATLQSLGSEAFAQCELLENVEYGFLGSVPDYCFYYCPSLKKITLPAGVTSIGSYAFYTCSSLEELTLPETLLQIGGSALSYCENLQSVVCPTIIPPLAESTFADNVDMTKATLYVPSYVLDQYRATSYWNDFYVMEPLETPISHIIVTDPVTLDFNQNATPLSESLDINLAYITDSNNNYHIGQLSVDEEGTLSAKKFRTAAFLGLRSNGSYPYDSYTGVIPTLINETPNMRADGIDVYMTLGPSGWNNVWHFISLPYEVKVSDIIATPGTNAAIRRYNSAARAEGAGGSYWYDLGADDVIEAGQGFILMGNLVDENGNYYDPTFKFPSGNTVSKNNYFRCDDAIVPLEEYVAEFAHNRSWNLIGNPYPSYFDMRYLNEEFTSPVLVWDAYYGVYRAYSPVDDDLILRPYESFFVQRPVDQESMTFKKEGRFHFDERTNGSFSAPSKEEVIDMAGRNVFNFNISKEEYTDKARIVLNPEATPEYEIGRDMSKFFGENAKGAQIYVTSDAQYSIDERPLGDGVATLGILACGSDASTDLYNIGVSGKFANEWSVLLTDNITGKTVDLTVEEYAFSATESNDSRFTVRFDNSVNGINDILADFNANEFVTVFTLDGIKAFEGNINDWQKESGIFVVRGEKAVRKVILK